MSKSKSKSKSEPFLPQTSSSSIRAEFESLSKNAIVRTYFRLRHNACKYLRPSTRGSVLFLSKRTCVKCGPTVQLSEAQSMHFISQHTSIPVPKIKCAFSRHNNTYIYMERINGKELREMWHGYSSKSQEDILMQLRHLIKEMRELPPLENNKIESISGAQLKDSRLGGSSIYFGPFDNITDFHRHLRYNVDKHPDPEIDRLIKFHNNGNWRSVFTHGDLSSLNILVRDGKIVGLLDWETAGYLPEYWEYINACMANDYNLFWKDQVSKFLDSFPEEHQMEILRRRLFDE